VVLIDEIEAHLHIELQKKIRPFLTSLFPNIQFIVTTHSPFVLMSDSNSIVFDLETKQLVEDMTKFSLDAIIETYFDSDKYSDLIKKKVAEYEELIKRIEELNESEEERLIDLRRALKDAPKTLAPELSLKLNQLEAAGVL
jgi:predicted ATP-binding protein involved in virulence